MTLQVAAAAARLPLRRLFAMVWMRREQRVWGWPDNSYLWLSGLPAARAAQSRKSKRHRMQALSLRGSKASRYLFRASFSYSGS